MPTYLDDNGNPIRSQQAVTYLDDQGKPLDAKASFAANQAARKKQLIAEGGLPADAVNYQPATPYEQAVAFAAHTAAAIPAASLGRYTAPLDAAISFGKNLQLTPEEISNKISSAVQQGSPAPIGELVHTPVTSAVSDAANAVANKAQQVAGVRPNAITDVPAAAGSAAGTVLAPYAEKGIADTAKTTAQTVADATAPIRQTLSQKTAPQIMRNMANPKNSAMQFGADPGEFLVGLKTEGNNLKSLEPQIEEKIQSLESKADKIAFNTERGRSVPIDYEQAIKDAFDRNAQEARISGNEGLASRLEQVRDKEIALLKQKTGGTGTAPAWAGRRYQQGLGNRVRTFSTDPADGTIRTARQEAWEAINDKTNQAVPQLASVNNQIHSGIVAKTAINNQALNQSKEAVGGLRQMATNAVTGPYVRSRVASGLRGLFNPSAPETQFLPNASSPFTPQPGQEIVNWFDRNATVPRGGSVNTGQPEGAIVDFAQGQTADPRSLSTNVFDRAGFSPQQAPPILPSVSPNPSQLPQPQGALASGDMGGAIPPHVMDDVLKLMESGRISFSDYLAWLNSEAQIANMQMLRYTKVP